MPKEIIGICLIKNEEVFINQIIKNILNFCDTILVLNNNSIDNTVCEISNINSDKIVLIDVENPNDTNKYLQKFVGTNTWVFGVDGDELYNPDKLKLLRKEILNGEWDDFSMLRHNGIHTFKIAEGKAYGYASPPSRHVGKLYNFAHFRGQLPRAERLHGMTFDNNINASKTHSDLTLDQKEKLNEYMYMLHLVFMKRTSVINFNKYINNDDNELWMSSSPATNSSKYKIDNYTKGNSISIPINGYFD